MIILCVVAALVFLAVKAFAVCIAALAALRRFLERRSAARATASVAVGAASGSSTVGAQPVPASVPADPPVTSTGPQDAPLGAPWRPVSGLPDTPGHLQDAPTGSPAEHLEESVQTTDVLSPQSVRRIVAQLAAVVVARQRGASFAVTELADGRLVLSLTVRPEGRSESRSEALAGVPAEEEADVSGGTILDLVPRPATGPAYLGGRDDDAYLRGWDDGVDWVRQGHPERCPSWSSAAYMTGWNDSLRAVAKVRCA